MLQFVWSKDFLPQANSPGRLRKLYRYIKSAGARMKEPAITSFNEDLEKARIRGLARAAETIRSTRESLIELSQQEVPRVAALATSPRAEPTVSA
jgi:hypothetical protein